MQHKTAVVLVFFLVATSLLVLYQTRWVSMEVVTPLASYRKKLPPIASAQVDVFQRLSSGFSHFFLFNAFDDYRSSLRLLRVMAIGNRFARLPLYCHILFADKVVTVPADEHREYFLPFMQQVTIDGFFLRCSFTSSGRPLAVSISTSASGLGANLIRVRRIPRVNSALGHDPTGVSSCVAPLFGALTQERVSEWIEVNRQLGVEHFVFYNFSLTAPISRLLQHYRRQGVVSVVPWRLKELPLPVMEVGTWPPALHKLHYIGQYVAFNDCLFRSVNRRRYIIFIDLDELFVPYRDANLTAFLDRLTNKSAASAVAFRNVYFPDRFPDERSLPTVLTLLRRTWRERRVLAGHTGAKLALVRDRVVIMQVHNYAFKWAGSGTVTAPEEEALMQHYRSPPGYLRLSPAADRGLREPRLLGMAGAVARSVRQAVAAAG